MKLKYVNIHQNYINRISENLKDQQLINTNDVNNVWNKIEDTVQQATKITIGIKKNRKKQ